jgi:imidazolonepropionase-like amidohydrolase
MVESGSVLCPVWTFLANLADFGPKAGSGTDALDWFRSEIEATAKMTRLAYDSGVPIACGTETGFTVTPVGEWHAREMELLVRYLGLSPLEAITCGTRNGTLVTREQGVTGELAPGMRADVLVIDADPLSDITVLQDRSRIRHVVCRGVDMDLTPVPPRRPLPGEQSMSWTAVPLTWKLARS